MFENREGQRVPAVTFRTRSGSDWLDLTTDDIFAGRTVIVWPNRDRVFPARGLYPDLLIQSCPAL
jgi:hypothetical protein